MFGGSLSETHAQKIVKVFSVLSRIVKNPDILTDSIVH